VTSDTTDYAGLLRDLTKLGDGTYEADPALYPIGYSAYDAIEALLAREAALIERVKELEKQQEQQK
jgi:hypothetical protein